MTPQPGFSVDEVARRRALMRDMQSYPRVVARLRAQLFLRHVELYVRTVTPLLHIVSRGLGMDLDGAIGRIRPPVSWPTVPLSADARMTSRGIERDFAFRGAEMLRRHRYAGTIVPRDSMGEDLVGVRIVGGSIELTVVHGDLRLETFHGFGRLLIDCPVPEIVASAVQGRPVSQLVDHPWLTDPGWKVVFVATRWSGRTSVVFETGQMPWRMKPEAAGFYSRGAFGC